MKCALHSCLTQLSAELIQLLDEHQCICLSVLIVWPVRVLRLPNIELRSHFEIDGMLRPRSDEKGGPDGSCPPLNLLARMSSLVTVIACEEVSCHASLEHRNLLFELDALILCTVHNILLSVVPFWPCAC